MSSSCAFQKFTTPMTVPDPPSALGCEPNASLMSGTGGGAGRVVVVIPRTVPGSIWPTVGLISPWRRRGIDHCVVPPHMRCLQHHLRRGLGSENRSLTDRYGRSIPRRIEVQFLTIPSVPHMRAAIDAARVSRELGDYAVGSSIVVGDQVIVASGNRTHIDVDPTLHAEIIVIREAARILGTKNLSHCVLYSTHEPCVMCVCAAVWARIPTVVYGATMEDHKLYSSRSGTSEWPWRVVDVPAAYIADRGQPRVVLIPGFMREECLRLFHS